MAPLEGVEEFAAAMQAWADRVHAATLAGVEDSAEELKEIVQDNLEQSEYPPASPRDTPPAIRSGDLRDSVEVSSEPTDTGAEARVWPSTVYARIQELGGIAGKDHRSVLPPRPYVQPSLDEVEPQVWQIMYDSWQSAATP